MDINKQSIEEHFEFRDMLESILFERFFPIVCLADKMKPENSFVRDVNYYPEAETLNFRVTEYWGGCGDTSEVYVNLPVAALYDEQVADEWEEAYMKETV